MIQPTDKDEALCNPAIDAQFDVLGVLKDGHYKLDAGDPQFEIEMRPSPRAAGVPRLCV